MRIPIIGTRKCAAVTGEHDFSERQFFKSSRRSPGQGTDYSEVRSTPAPCANRCTALAVNNAGMTGSDDDEPVAMMGLGAACRRRLTS